MDLICLQGNLFGQAIVVNGNRYAIDATGKCAGVADIDAKKLLSMRFWKSAQPIAPVKVVAPVAVAPAPKPAPAPAPVVAPIAPVAAQPEPGSEDYEWPDPDEAMEIDYLREMAEAYGVPFDDKTTKKTLVKRIKSAMYES
jgi:hypothetical protein